MGFINNMLDPTRKSDLVEIEISGNIPEESTKLSIPFVKVKNKITVLDFDILFEHLKNSIVKSVLIRIKPLGIGLSRANHIRNKILRLSNSGIKTTVYLDNPGNIEYFIATAADKIYLPKWSTLNTIGLSSDTFYLKSFLNKVYIESEFISKGNYKSASEMFMRDEMSKYNREMITSILDQSFDLIISKISHSRNMNKKILIELFNNGPYHSKDAFENKLIDGVFYYDEVKIAIEKDISQKVRTSNETKILK